MNHSPKQDAYLKKIGERIRAIRKTQGHTMDWLASEANMESRQLGRIERGEINTSILALARISQALRVDIRELFND